MKKFIYFILTLVLIGLSASPSFASTLVPGMQSAKYDADNNGIPDVGKVVTGKYTSVYAYDVTGAYFWDLGDGRIQSTPGITSVEDLDQSTLTTCNYQVIYRGTFENDPYMDSGWIINNINCHGYDDNGQYNAVIVNESDPRYRGNPEQAIWGNWEYHTNVESHKGNLVRPYKAVGM